MSAGAAQVVGALIACSGAAGALLLADPRRRYLAIGVGLLAGAALIAGEVWDQERFADLRSQPAVVIAAVVLGGVALGATAAFLVRNPAVFAIAAFAVLPLRLPVQVGDETNFLLLPLYGVIAGGWLRGAWLIASGRADELQTPTSPGPGESGLRRWLCLALAAALLVYAAGVAWTEDARNAIVTVAFFLTPFAALLALLRDMRWHRKLLGQVLAGIVGVALVFAVIGLWQYATGDLILNQQLKDANQLHMYFRVNSLFRDPNMLGRYLVLALIALAAWIAWRETARQAIGGALAAAVLLAALVLTYSQTSFAALLAGLAVLVWFRLGGKGLAIAVATAAIAVAALPLASPPSDDSVQRERDDLAETTSGRTGLIDGGLELFEREPLVGQGSGSFTIAYRRQIEKLDKPVSHTEPVTVAAEQGILGLVPYAAILVLSFVLVLRPWPRSAGRAAVAAAYAALLIHTLGYAAFLIDPATWAILALALVLRE